MVWEHCGFRNLFDRQPAIAKVAEDWFIDREEDRPLAFGASIVPVGMRQPVEARSIVDWGASSGG